MIGGRSQRSRVGQGLFRRRGDAPAVGSDGLRAGVHQQGVFRSPLGLSGDVADSLRGLLFEPLGHSVESLGLLDFRQTGAFPALLHGEGKLRLHGLHAAQRVANLIVPIDDDAIVEMALRDQSKKLVEMAQRTADGARGSKSDESSDQEAEADHARGEPQRDRVLALHRFELGASFLDLNGHQLLHFRLDLVEQRNDRARQMLPECIDLAPGEQRKPRLQSFFDISGSLHRERLGNALLFRRQIGSEIFGPDLVDGLAFGANAALNVCRRTPG